MVLSLLLATCLGCVTRGTYDELLSQNEQVAAERDRLNGEVARLQIERESFETQYLEAQEAYEDERIAREGIAAERARIADQATRLDRDLGAERIARMEAAKALALRETQIASMQSTYNELVSDLESEVTSGQIEIQRLREGLRLNVSDEILFASGSAKLDTKGRDVLVRVAARLKDLEDTVTVRGHTDNLAIRGALAKIYPSNWELAAARAASVVRIFEAEGISGNRLAVVSIGPNEPIAPNDTPENRALNRRIEIRLEPRRPTDSASTN
jgi:chemotaxis protein MotB